MHCWPKISFSSTKLQRSFNCCCWSKCIFEHFCLPPLLFQGLKSINVDQQTLNRPKLDFCWRQFFYCHNTALDASLHGRNSVRIKSKNVYANNIIIWQYRLEFNRLALVSICTMSPPQSVSRMQVGALPSRHGNRSNNAINAWFWPRSGLPIPSIVRERLEFCNFRELG